MKTRRFFAGNTLAQALMAAARYHGLSPEELAYRPYEKRHGFVNRVRRCIVEVDPAAPQRVRVEGRPAATPAPAPAAPVARPPRLAPAALAAPPAPAAPAPAAPPSDRAVPQVSAVESRRPARPTPPPTPSRAASAGTSAATPRPHAGGAAEPYLPPDEESELAAAAAMGRLLALSALELAAKVERRPDRLVISLSGKDEELLGDLGEEFLDDLEQLLPRAIRGLTGRMVRCRVEGGGLRSAHELELRGMAERAAEQVIASGEAVLLEPLSSADRRIVHLALVDDPRVATESEGFGAEKRIRVSLAAPVGGN